MSATGGGERERVECNRVYSSITGGPGLVQGCPSAVPAVGVCRDGAGSRGGADEGAGGAVGGVGGHDAAPAASCGAWRGGGRIAIAKSRQTAATVYVPSFSTALLGIPKAPTWCANVRVCDEC